MIFPHPDSVHPGSCVFIGIFFGKFLAIGRGGEERGGRSLAVSCFKAWSFSVWLD